LQLQAKSAQLAKSGRDECGLYLCGNVVSTDGNMVVRAGSNTFTVQPPDRGEIWVTLSARPGDLVEGDDVRVSLPAPGRTDARLVNVYRRVTDGGEKGRTSGSEAEQGTAAAEAGGDRSSDQAVSKVSGRSSNARAERLFKNALRQLKRGKRDAALELFDQAKAADPSDAMAQRIAAVLPDGTLASDPTKKTPAPRKPR
jgi:hypothetical protein